MTLLMDNFESFLFVAFLTAVLYAFAWARLELQKWRYRRERARWQRVHDALERLVQDLDDLAAR
jgi:hypothetical protein